jgi:dTDP-4-amino-4,6-dideoxygalactose transaminase
LRGHGLAFTTTLTPVHESDTGAIPAKQWGRLRNPLHRVYSRYVSHRRDTLLSFSPPAIGDEEIAEVVAALRSGWITTGPRTRIFEQSFARFTGAAAALALNSATGALHVALAALGVGRGSAVITTTLTFAAGVHVIEHVGARPVLVDVEPDTLNIDPVQVARAARSLHPGERLAAIIPVHLYGHPCDRTPLIEIARNYRCALVEDAAHSFPSRFEGKMIGAAEDVGVPVLTAFSFYANKNLTTGEGGMLTGPAELVEEARLWSLHGMSCDAWKRTQGDTAPGKHGSWFYEVNRPGFKYNMTDVQAALGIAQLPKITGFGIRRAEIAARYNEAFERCEALQIPAHRSRIEHAWHVYALRLNAGKLNVSRDEFIEELRKRNIAASVHFIPIHIHPYYRNKYGFKRDDFPVAYSEYQRLVSLPIYPTMLDRDIDDVIEAVTEIAAENRKASTDLAEAKA